MSYLSALILTSVVLCLHLPQTYSSVQSARVPESCADDFPFTCNLQCPNGNYLLDDAGCPKCVCASGSGATPEIHPPEKECPMIKCRANCGEAGYQSDARGCQTCKCASSGKAEIVPKPHVECSRFMCRMACAHGYRRDENGCEICSCNETPQPCPQVTCENACSTGYEKDYSGCPTCTCKDDHCSPMTCDLSCKYGFQRDVVGCPLCACNRCPLQMCRMFCMFGFKKNADGCDVCECEWAPVSEKIPCSGRQPCLGARVCNLNLNLCETVLSEDVNWFVYNFDVHCDHFNDPQYVQAFKNDFVNNVAMKYDLEPTQVKVSKVEGCGMISFQVMPFYVENRMEFQKKIDQIDVDLNSHEFRTVLPAVARIPEKPHHHSAWRRFLQQRPGLFLYATAVGLGFVALILAGLCILMVRRRNNYPMRSESKVPINDASYHQAPTEDDHYHAVRAPDGTAYVVVESDEMHASNDKRALV